MAKDQDWIGGCCPICGKRTGYLFDDWLKRRIRCLVHGPFDAETREPVEDDPAIAEQFAIMVRDREARKRTIPKTGGTNDALRGHF